MKKVIIIALTALLNIYPTGCNTSSQKKSHSDTAISQTPPLPANMDSITTNFRRSMKIWSPAILKTDSLLYWDFIRMDSLQRKWEDSYTSL